MAFDLMNIVSNLLSNPGDKAEARITKNNRKVGTYVSGDGKFKASITEYPNGTIHETRTFKK